MSENRGGVSTYAAYDVLGNLWFLDNAGAAQTYYQDTTAFGSGQGMGLGGATGSPFKYGGANGCQTDADTGLVLMGHRYYDTRLGRFLSQDPAGSGDNWYAYAGNDPVDEVDPTGLDPDYPGQPDDTGEIPGFDGTPTGYGSDGRPWFSPDGSQTGADGSDPSTFNYDLDSYGYRGPDGPSSGGGGSGGTDWASEVDNWVTFGSVTNAGNIAGMYDSGHASRGAAIGAGALAVGAIVAAGASDGEDVEASAASRLPDFTGWVLKQIEEHLGNAGFSERKLIEGSTSLMRTFDHADGSKVTLDMAKNFAKVNGPKQWASDMARKFQPRLGPHNQPFLP